MITIEKIKKNARKHHTGGKRTIISNGKIILSIVGGQQGLYGDFIDTFEVAIRDVETSDFITDVFLDTGGDDVKGFLSSDELESLCNKLFKKGFQFIKNP